MGILDYDKVQELDTSITPTPEVINVDDVGNDTANLSPNLVPIKDVPRQIGCNLYI